MLCLLFISKESFHVRKLIKFTIIPLFVIIACFFGCCSEMSIQKFPRAHERLQPHSFIYLSIYYIWRIFEAEIWNFILFYLDWKTWKGLDLQIILDRKWFIKVVKSILKNMSDKKPKTMSKGKTMRTFWRQSPYGDSNALESKNKTKKQTNK